MFGAARRGLCAAAISRGEILGTHRCRARAQKVAAHAAPAIACTPPRTACQLFRHPSRTAKPATKPPATNLLSVFPDICLPPPLPYSLSPWPIVPLRGEPGTWVERNAPEVRRPHAQTVRQSPRVCCCWGHTRKTSTRARSCCLPSSPRLGPRRETPFQHAALSPHTPSTETSAPNNTQHPPPRAQTPLAILSPTPCDPLSTHARGAPACCPCFLPGSGAPASSTHNTPCVRLFPPHPPPVRPRGGIPCSSPAAGSSLTTPLFRRSSPPAVVAGHGVPPAGLHVPAAVGALVRICRCRCRCGLFRRRCQLVVVLCRRPPPPPAASASASPTPLRASPAAGACG